MNQTWPLTLWLEEVAEPRDCTDITLTSEGNIALRRRCQLTTTHLPAVKECWATITATYFPDRPRDHRSAITKILVGPRGRRFRAALTKNHSGESIAVRPLSSALPTTEELTLPESLVRNFLQLRSGLFLVGGPTGSGKSSTVAALLQARGTSVGGKFVTIEDPVEYIHEGGRLAIFEQRELGTSVVSYAEGLKEALHMNPDVIAVQEIRDSAAAETALAAALSGHLVVASLHAFSAATAPQRYLSLLGSGWEEAGARDALASALEAVVVQRLEPGIEQMVPLFEIMVLRDRGERIHSMERLVRQGQWAGLRQEIEIGGRLGMLTWEQSRAQRIAEGTLAA